MYPKKRFTFEGLWDSFPHFLNNANPEDSASSIATTTRKKRGWNPFAPSAKVDPSAPPKTAENTCGKPGLPSALPP
jgi:hypothetical protein